MAISHAYYVIIYEKKKGNNNIAMFCFPLQPLFIIMTAGIIFVGAYCGRFLYFLWLLWQVFSSIPTPVTH